MRTRACYPRSCRCRCSPVDKNTVCDFVRPRFEPGSGRRQKLREREGERIWRQGAIRQGESPPMSATCEFHGSIEWNSPRQRRGMESDPGGGFRFTFLVSWFSGLVFANQQRGWEFLASLVRRFVVLAAKLEILTCEFWLHSSRAYPGCLADSLFGRTRAEYISGEYGCGLVCTSLNGGRFSKNLVVAVSRGSDIVSPYSFRSLESFENLFPIYTDQFRHGRPHFPPKAVAKTFAFLRHRVHHGFEAIWEINVLFGSNSESFHAVERA